MPFGVEPSFLQLKGAFVQFPISPVSHYARMGVPESEQRTIAEAMRILEARLAMPRLDLTSPPVVKDFLRLRYAPLDVEVFGVVWLTALNSLIAVEEMFRGTISQTSVYPREVVRRGLQLNAAACIVFHNHPSGCAEPSRADEYLTTTLKSALALVDLRLLDHIVVGSGGTVSLAERGLI